METSVLENIKQLCLIVFSVVLGLFLSERIEERKKEKEATMLLSRIKAEVADNMQLMEYWAPYHREIVHSLDSLGNSDTFINSFIKDKTSLFNVLHRGTFMGRMPVNDAWDIAKSHPLIVHFDYNELLILSRIYNQQKVTFEPMSKISDLFFTNDFNAEEKAEANLQKFKSQMQEIVSRELQLMEYFKEGKNILKLQSN